MSSKPSYPFENHDAKVDELRTYLRWSKRLFYALIAVMVVNLLLTYGLLFHPSKPSVETCAPFCPSIHTRENLDTIFAQESSPDLLPSTELVVREVETKDIEARSPGTEVAELEERWDYGDVRTGIALAMAAYWVPNQAIQWWNMVAACQDFSSASNAVNCVWGAVSTVITASGTLYAAYQGYGHISTWMSNNGISMGGFKRQEIEQALLDEFSGVFGAQVSHLGVWNYAAPTNGSAVGKRDQVNATLDVFGFNSNGMDIHFSYLGNATSAPTFKFGYGTGQTSSSSKLSKTKRETYDEQYFESGGIDFVLFQPDIYNYPSGSALDSYTDYSWIYDQVSCIMASGMTAAGHYFQIYDNVHQTTLSAGAIAPFSGLDHWSAITQMEAPKGGIAETPSCNQAKKRGEEFQA